MSKRPLIDPGNISIKFACSEPVFFPDSEYPMLAYVIRCMNSSQYAYFKEKWGPDVFNTLENPTDRRNWTDYHGGMPPGG